MRTMRTVFFGVAIAAGSALCAMAPAQAADASFYIGPGGVRIYVDEHGDRYTDRYYRHRYHEDEGRHLGWNNRCYDRVSFRWRWGERYRVVDKICTDRFGRTKIVDRDYFRVRS